MENLRDKDTKGRRMELVRRLKAVLLDEIDEIVVALFIRDKEICYWQHSSDLRVQQEFKMTVTNIWMLLSCISIDRETAIQIAFTGGKSLVEIKERDVKLIVNFLASLKRKKAAEVDSERELNKLVILLQNINFLEEEGFYTNIDRCSLEKFLAKLIKSEMFATTRLDKHCLDWEPEKHEKLQRYLAQDECKKAVNWLIKIENQSKKFISEQYNSRANTLLVDQLEKRERQNFVKSNSFDDALCFEDIFYILKRINESAIAHVCDVSLSREEIIHGSESLEETCVKLLERVLESKRHVQHVYLLKNEVKEGVMGHWTVLCYQRRQSSWNLCQYYNPSGQGFRCGDRCVKWILSHATKTFAYVTLPDEISKKLTEQNSERQITWDMTEYIKQMEDFVKVSIPTYIMADEGEMVNIVPINTSDNEDSSSSSDLSDSESTSDKRRGGSNHDSDSGLRAEDLEDEEGWCYIPTVMEVLSNSFTHEEIQYLLDKHGFGPEVSIADAIEALCADEASN